MIDQTNIGVTGYIPFGYFRVWPATAGSTYLRFDQMNALDPSFEPWIHGKKYDNLIFQKAYWTEMMEAFQGPKIIDICDPQWLNMELDFVEAGNRVHAITCSSEGLTRLVKDYFPAKIVEHVPDRYDFKMLPSARGTHQGKARKAVWFGYTHNAHETLEQLLPALKKHELKLRIIGDLPYSQEDGILTFQPEFIRYDRASVYELIRQADMLLNPRSERGFFRYKSNNKSVVGWHLGLPVAVTCEDIERLIDPQERNTEVIRMKAAVKREYDIRLSAEQYRDIITRIHLGIT